MTVSSIPTRKPATSVLIAVAAVFVLVLTLVVAQTPTPPATAAGGGVANSADSQARIKVRSVVKHTRPCPTGPGIKCPPKKGTEYHTWVHPGGVTNRGSAQIPSSEIIGVWLPRNCKHRWASRSDQTIKGGYNKVKHGVTFEVRRCG